MAVLAPPRLEHDLKLELKTYDDLLAMPDDGNRYELIFGEIVMSPAPATKHQHVLGQLYLRFSNHLERRGLGVVFLPPYDVRFSIHSVVQPDLLVVRRERAAIVTKQNVYGSPDLVVEILSPSNRMQDLTTKAALYADFGVPEYWIVDPETDRITINVLRDGQFAALQGRGGFVRSEILPGLKVRVADVFAMPDWLTEVADSPKETE